MGRLAVDSVRPTPPSTTPDCQPLRTTPHSPAHREASIGALLSNQPGSKTGASNPLGALRLRPSILWASYSHALTIKGPPWTPGCHHQQGVTEEHALKNAPQGELHAQPKAINKQTHQPTMDTQKRVRFPGNGPSLDEWKTR